MTEIPEHLLKRSRERREALGGSSSGEAAAGSDVVSADAGTSPAVTAPAAAAAAPAAPAPAVTPAPVPLPVTPAPPPPDPPYVAAYKSRKKIPMWAMMTLSILPVWAFMYVRSVTPSPVVIGGPIGEGEELYGSAACAGCHGADGGGGVGRPLAEGEVILTFPRIEDMVSFVYWGSEEYANAGIETYGDPNREGGAHAPGSFGANMPAQGELAGGALTDEQILAVVCHERFGFDGGLEPVEENPEFIAWCSEDSEAWLGLEDGSLTFASPELVDIGQAPRPSLEDQTPPAALEGGGEGEGETETAEG